MRRADDTLACIAVVMACALGVVLALLVMPPSW